jgi:predicted O-linked N-acetylglucosamine transferase (SPINDLY family)
MAGETMRARHTAAVLSELGLGAMVSADTAAYLAAAVSLARDPTRRAAEREAIRAALQRLNQVSAIPALEAHLLAGATDAPTS